MAIYLNFKDFTFGNKAGGGGTAVISAEALKDLTSVAQLKRFGAAADTTIPKGTTMIDGCKLIFDAMNKKLGESSGDKFTKADSTKSATELKEESDAAAAKKNTGGNDGISHTQTDRDRKAPTGTTTQKRVGYDKAAKVVQDEYIKNTEALKEVARYVGNQVPVLAKMRKERDDNLAALKVVKAYL